MVGYIYPATEQMVIVNEIEAGLANATVHLMQAGLTFTPQTNAADLATVEKRLTAARRDAKAGDKKHVRQVQLLETWEEQLSRGDFPSWPPGVVAEDEDFLRDCHLLSLKPTLYALNVADEPKESVKRLSSESVYLEIAALRAFYRFAENEKLLPVNVAENLSLPRRWKRLPKALSNEEIGKLLTPEQFSQMSPGCDMGIGPGGGRGFGFEHGGGRGSGESRGSGQGPGAR